MLFVVYSILSCQRSVSKLERSFPSVLDSIKVFKVDDDGLQGLGPEDDAKDLKV